MGKQMTEAEKKKAEELVRVDTQIATIQDKTEKYRAHFQALLPRGAGVNIDQLKVMVAGLIRKEPRLAQCSIVSFMGGLAQAAKLGLKLDVLGQAYLIPRKNHTTGIMDACFQLGYPGAMALARRSGVVTKIEARVVYEHDQFSYQLGTSPLIEHVPARRDRGKLDACYAVAWIANAPAPQFEVLEEEDVLRIKASAQGASNSDSPWQKWPDRMWQKSALLRLCKYLPSSEDLQEAIAIDAAGEVGLDQHLVELLPAGIKDDGDADLDMVSAADLSQDP